MSATKSIFLDGVALANYRGIGSDAQLIGPFDQFNFFIGPNNSGKSCILHFIANHLEPLVLKTSRDSQTQLSPIDTHLGATESPRLGVGVSRKSLEGSIASVWPGLLTDGPKGVLLDSVLSEMTRDGFFCIARADDGRSIRFYEQSVDLAKWQQLKGANAWPALWSHVTNQQGGSLLQHWIPETLNTLLSRIRPTLPRISIIPAIREVSESGQAFNTWDGRGLIDELARLQNPGFHEPERFEKFQAVNRFLQTVTERPEARVEIPHDRKSILVHMDEKRLPLESLGTGIHEVVMLAAFCTLMEKQIVCIEEPEIHLHPILQRRLMQYLQDNTDNQYFIATHSAAFIDTPNAAVFHVTNRDGKTVVRSALTPANRFDVVQDLGYRASDLLQANAVIWVEGPSDRIYLRHWISEAAPELREGIDYSIMFYGGRLLSHLRADDPAEAEQDIASLIAIRRLNRNLAIVIDSDKDSETASINSTKKRICDEIEAHEGIAWVTAGREIENYVVPERLSAALRKVYRGFAKQQSTKPFGHALPFVTTEGKKIKDVDKVRVAKAVCSSPAELDTLDLKAQVGRLVQFIRDSNL